MKKIEHIPTANDIIETHEAIAHMIHRTSVLTNESIDEIIGAKLFFKCENFQKIGAFKMRGGANAALRLSPEELAKGLTTHSSGNHAQAVARSAKLLNVPAYIVMPEDAPIIKQNATRGYGAEIIFCKANIESRTSTLKVVQEKTQATFIHPFDNYDVIAGQATAAKELIEDAGPFDIIMSPIGGGGLMSGTALSVKYFGDGAITYGAEPKEVDDAYRSVQMGSVQKNPTINTIADGLRTNLSEKTFEIIRDNVKEIFTVTEESIVEAMRLTWERMKIIIEPSCAVPLAAIMSNKEHFAGKKVGVILTGGNVDLAFQSISRGSSPSSYSRTSSNSIPFADSSRRAAVQ